jgi:hypothetical protein
MLNFKELSLLIISVLGAGVAITIGYLMPSTGTNILKDIMVFGGGAGLAYVFASAGGRATSNRDAEAAKERLRSLCNRTVQRLGLAASQTVEASTLVRAFIAEPKEAEIVSALLENVAEQAQVSMGDLEEMAGGKIALDRLVNNALSSLQEVADDFPNDLKQKVTEALIRPLEQFKEATSIGRSPVIFPCPKCSSKLTTVLADLPGSTGHTWCGTCLSRVVVHRGANGTLTSKILNEPMGAPSVQSCSVVVACPGCAKPIPVTPRPDDGPVIVRNCFNCNEQMFIDKDRRQVLRSQKTLPLRTVFVPYNSKLWLRCPSCENPIRVNEPAGERRAIKINCARCTALIEASHIEVEIEGEKAAVGSARSEYLSGNPVKAAATLGVVIDLSSTTAHGTGLRGSANAPLGFQKGSNGLLALARGNLELARSAFDEARKFGLAPAMCACNEVMLAIVTGSATETGAALRILGGVSSNPVQTIQLEALRAISLCQGESAPEMTALSEALAKCSYFDLRRSPLRYLQLGLQSVGRSTPPVVAVFSLLEKTATRSVSSTR